MFLRVVFLTPLLSFVAGNWSEMLCNTSCYFTYFICDSKKKKPHTLLSVHPWLWKHRQLAPHAPTPSTGRDNTRASCGFEAVAPGLLLVPSFLCLNRRKEALSSTRPRASKEWDGVCLSMWDVTLHERAKRFCALRSCVLTHRFLSYLTFQYVNFSCDE